MIDSASRGQGSTTVRLARVLACIGALLLAFACRKESAPPLPGAALTTPTPRGADPSAAQPRGAPTSGASATPRRTGPAELALADVELLLSGWLGAQNALDFVSYTRRYADRFTGIKRVGSREQRFDREAWLEDRRPMFTPGLRVEAKDVDYAIAGTTARVRFTQVFSTERFKDEGPKELVVIATEQGPRIAREEMLESRVAGFAASPGDAPIWALRDGVVHLRELPAEAAMVGPILRVSASPTTHAAERAVNLEQLTAEQRGWIGRRLVAVSATGERCSVEIGELAARVEVVPHFSTTQRWEGVHYGDDPPPEKLSEETVLQEIWELGSSGAELIGKLVTPCDAALFAVEQDPELVLSASAPSAELEHQLLERFAALADAKRIQAEYAGWDPPLPGSWLGEADKRVVVFAPHGSLQTAVVSASLGHGCGDFSGALSAVFELDARGKDAKDGAKPRVVRQQVVTDASILVEVKTALDLDADGRLEFVVLHEDLRESVNYWRSLHAGFLVQTLRETAYFDCPC